MSEIHDITIKDVGPIEHITIPVPEGGGIVVFKGVNGCGKTIALDAIDAAVSGKGRVPVRDGQLHGEVQAHGVTLRLGRSTRRKGEAEVTSLEGRVSIADLVDPGIKAPEAADAHRIQALVSLAAGEPDIKLFNGLLEDFDMVVTPGTLDSPDLVTMAGRVKRDIENHARVQESIVENSKRDADVAAKAAEGSDASWAKPEGEVDGLLEQAIERRAEIKAKTEANTAAIVAATGARELLKNAEASYEGPTYEEAVKRREIIAASLRDLQSQVTETMSDLRAAVDAAKWAEEHEALTAAWRTSIDKAAEIQQAEQQTTLAAERGRAERDVEYARESVVLSAEGRKALEQLKLQSEAEKRQVAAETRAQLLRDAAAGTDEVLSQVIAESGIALRVQPVNQQMRLVCRTDRGVIPFSELSPGERWRIALDIAAKALGAGGEITIPQHAWEAMDPANQAAIVQQLKDTGIIAYTAVSSLGPLRAEVV